MDNHEIAEKYSWGRLLVPSDKGLKNVSLNRNEIAISLGWAKEECIHVVKYRCRHSQTYHHTFWEIL